MTDVVLLGHRWNATGDELIASIRRDRGCGPNDRLNCGACAWADWLMLSPGNQRRFNAMWNQGDTLAERILAGEIVPSDGVALLIAEMTNGAVRPEVFDVPIAPPAPTQPAAGEGKTPAAAGAGEVGSFPSPAPFHLVRGVEDRRWLIGVHSETIDGLTMLCVVNGPLAWTLERSEAEYLWRELGERLAVSA